MYTGWAYHTSWWQVQDLQHLARWRRWLQIGMRTTLTAKRKSGCSMSSDWSIFSWQMILLWHQHHLWLYNAHQILSSGETWLSMCLSWGPLLSSASLETESKQHLKRTWEIVLLVAFATRQAPTWPTRKPCPLHRVWRQPLRTSNNCRKHHILVSHQLSRSSLWIRCRETRLLLPSQPITIAVEKDMVATKCHFKDTTCHNRLIYNVHTHFFKGTEVKLTLADENGISPS